MILFIDNYDSFSYNIIQYLMQTGRTPLVLTNDNPKVLELATSPELESVILSPGPSNPENAGYCLEFLKRLPHHIPVLGICLGHQCLGAHAGCPVVRGPRVMHGKNQPHRAQRHRPLSRHRQPHDRRALPLPRRQMPR